MKKQLTTDYLEWLAQTPELTTSHYRILLMLMTGSYTQAQLCVKLNIANRQNVNKAIRELEKLGMVEVDRIEGRNKFMKAVTSVKKIKTGEPMSADSPVEGQLTLGEN